MIDHLHLFHFSTRNSFLKFLEVPKGGKTIHEHVKIIVLRYRFGELQIAKNEKMDREPNLL